MAGRLRRFSWQTVQRSSRSRPVRWLAAGVVLVAVALWLAPRRVGELAPVGGDGRWSTESAPPRRVVIWRASEEIRDLPEPEDAARGTGRDGQRLTWPTAA